MQSHPRKSDLPGMRLLAFFIALVAISVHDRASYGQQGPIRFVDYTAQGSATGESWQDAYVNPHAALAAAAVPGSGITSVWIAQGTYVPPPESETVPGNPYTATFTLPSVSQLLILGGFPNGGGDGTISASNPTVYKTYLSGDRDGDDQTISSYATWWPNPPQTDTLTDNVFHVCTANVGANVTLRGCTIRAGFARLLDPDVPNSELGGGVFILTGTPTLRNLVFEYCQSLGDQAPRAACGGGLYSKGSNLDIRDCTFRRCDATMRGGGLCKVQGDLLAVRCRFEGCRAIAPGGRGGGLRVDLAGGEVHAVNCVFGDCHAESFGGGASIGSPLPGETDDAFCAGIVDDQGFASFTNCLFIGNVANGIFVSCGGGGGAGLRTVHPTEIHSCTFVKNRAKIGSAIASYHEAPLLVANSIIWDNPHVASSCSSGLSDLDKQVFVCILTPCPTACLLNLKSSVVPGFGSDPPCSTACAWSDNIESNPKFFDGDNATDDGSDYNLRLSGGSPCVDEANNGLVPPDHGDLDGDGVTIDDPGTTPIEGETVPFDLDMTPRIQESHLSATVDMGAYEKPCRSNLDSDCDVDGFDLALLLQQWTGLGVSYPNCPPYRTGDLDSDCDVDGFDLGILNGEWGACPGCETGGGAGAAAGGAGGGAGEAASSSMPGGLSDDQVHLLLIIWLATQDWDAALAWAQTVLGSGEPSAE